MWQFSEINEAAIEKKPNHNENLLIIDKIMKQNRGL